MYEAASVRKWRLQRAVDDHSGGSRFKLDYLSGSIVVPSSFLVSVFLFESLFFLLLIFRIFCIIKVFFFFFLLTLSLG